MQSAAPGQRAHLGMNNIPLSHWTSRINDHGAHDRKMISICFGGGMVPPDRNELSASLLLTPQFGINLSQINALFGFCCAGFRTKLTKTDLNSLAVAQFWRSEFFTLP